MAKQFKVLVNTGKAENNQVIDVTQGQGAKGQPVRIAAKAGAKYQLLELDKNKEAAPENVKVKRVGKNLHILLEDSTEADIIIEDYYEVMPEGYNGVIGQAENGNFYEYIPEDPDFKGLIPQLADGGQSVSMALGGSEVVGSGAAVGFLAFNPLLAALGLAGAGAAAAAAGGTTATTTGVAITDATDNVGNPGNAIESVAKGGTTNDNTPTLKGTGTAGQVITIKDGANIIGSTTVNPDGTWSFTAPEQAIGPHSYTASSSTGTTSEPYALNIVAPEAGNSTSLSIDPITADNLINATEAGATNTTITGKVSGLFTVGDKVTLTINNNSTYTATVAADGSYSVSVKTSDLLADTDTQIDGTVTTSAGTAKAIQKYGVDTVVPNGGQALGLLITTDTNNDGWLNRKELAGATIVQATATFDASKAQVGDKVIISLADGSQAQTIILDAASKAAGQVIASFAAPSEGASLNLKAVMQDGAGNTTPEATDSAKLDLTDFSKPDPLNPTDPTKRISAVGVTIDTDATGAGDGVITAAELAATGGQIKVTILLPQGAAVGDTLTVNASGNAERLITLTQADITAQKIVITDYNSVGNNNTFTVTASIKDIAGNTSPTPDASDSAIFKTSLPTGTISIDAVTGDDLVSASEATGTVTITGSVTGTYKVGDIVTITVGGSSFTGTVNAAGQYSVAGIPGSKLVDDFNTGDKAVSASIVAHDSANNSATYTATPRPFTLDGNTEGAKTALTLNPITGDNIIDTTEGAVVKTTLTGKATGTFASGDVVTISLGLPGSVKTYTGTVNAAGDYSITVDTADLKADTDSQVEARIAATVSSTPGATKQTAIAAQDYVVQDSTNVGKITAISLDPVTADNIINAAESTTTIAITGKVTGAFTAGNTVTLMVKGAPVTGSVNAQGVFSISVPAADLIADSNTQIEASITGSGGTLATALQNYAVDTTIPVATLTIDAISLDTGTSSTDFVTKDNDGLTVTGTLSTALTAGQKLWYSNDNGATWTDITAAVSGTAVSHVDTALTSTNTVQMRVGSAGSNYGTPATQLVIIDTSSTTNQPDNSTDPNTAATITISSIDDGDTTLDAASGSKDTGASTSDFVTSDNKLSFFGTTTGFNGTAGAKVFVQILDANNAVVAEQYVTPDAQGQWKFDNQANAVLADGSYTIAASIVDKAGNPVKTDTQALVIKTSVDPTDPNTTATVDITSMTTDSGVSSSDFITNDNVLTYSGTVAGFTANGDKVKVELLAANGTTVIATAYVDVTATTGGNGTWTWAYETAQPDGQYTVRATIVDTAGNRTNATPPTNGTGGGQDTQVVIVDTSGGTVQPSGQPDPNATATIDIVAITDDSGVSGTDFITNDKSLTYSGTVTGFTANGDKVKVELLSADGTTVLETAYVDVTGASSTTAGAGAWTWTRSAEHNDGQYTLRATIVDTSGNRTNATAPSNGTGGGQDTQVVIVDTDGGKNQPDGSTNPNNTASVDITSMTTDSGVSSTDFVTNDNLLTYSGTVAGFTANGDKVLVELLAADGTTVIAKSYVDVTVTTGTNGTWTWAYETTQPDGQYTVRATIVDTSGNRVNTAAVGQDTQVVIVDSSTGTNQPDGSTDPNNASTVTIAIGGIDDGDSTTSKATGSKDTGEFANDNITSDGTLTFAGTTANFNGTQGAMVHVQVFNASNVAVVDEYVTPDANGDWTFDNQGAALPDGAYTIKAAIVDKAGNPVKVAADVPLIVDSSSTTNQPDGSTDPNSGSAATITVTRIDDGDTSTDAITGSKDTGELVNDFITSDSDLTFYGTTTGFNSTNGAKVRVQILDANNAVVAEQYVLPDAQGQWKFDNQAAANLLDGHYTIQADIVDKAGNPVQTSSHALVIQTTVDPTDPNLSATVAVNAITDDTGVSTSDFITSDNKLTYSGTVAGFTNNGDKVKLELLAADGVTVVATKYVVPTLSGTAPSSGTWTWAYDTTQADGEYTIRATIVDKADLRVNTAAGGQSEQIVIVDTDGGTNQPDGSTNPNTSATIDIVAITDDSGVSSSDFTTNDKSLTYSGTVSNFTANGDKVKVELLAADGNTVLETTYVDVTGASSTTAGAGSWSWTRSAEHNDGQYTLRATIVDTSGNRTNATAPSNGTGGGQDTQVLIIDTDGGKNQPDGSTNPNTAATIDIVAITDDSGVSGTDFITNDKSLTYSGTVTGFTANGDKVKLELLSADGITVLETTYVDVTGASSTTAGAGTWTWTRTTDHTDGQYTLRATIVDTSGNRTNATAPTNGTGGGQDTQVVIVDTDGGKNQPDGSTNPNSTASVDITSMTTDSGVSATDFVTNDNSLTYNGTVSGFTANGDKVKVELLEANGTTVIATAYVDVTVTTGTNGTWTWAYETAQPDGQYTVRATIVDTSGNRTNTAAVGQDTQVVIVDTDGGKNQPDGSTNSNNTASVDITSMTTDSGVSSTDFITNDKSLTYSGTVSNFTANGDKVKVELLEANGTTVIATAYMDVTVTSGTNGTWTWAYETAQPDGQYTVRATIVDTSGNRTNTAAVGQDTQVVIVDTDGGTNQPDGSTNPNNTASVDITSMTTDSGVSSTDFITNDKSLTYSGTVSNFTANGDKIMVELLAADGSTVIASDYVDVTVTTGTNGTWTWAYETAQPDGQYTVRATIVDTSGNRTNTAAVGQDTQVVIVDTDGSKNQPDGTPDANSTASVDITSMTTDSGSDTTDFTTSDTTLTYSGTVAGFTANGDKVKVELLAADGTTVIATAYVDVTITTGGNGTWTWPYETTQLQGNYSVRATLVDPAGNRVNMAAVGQDLQAIVIDTTGPTPVVSPEDPLNPPAGKTSLSVDSVTTDNTLNATEAGGSVTITGTVRGDFTAGDIVTLTIKGTPYSGTVNASGVYSIPVPGADLAADDDKTIDASLLAHDKSGNPGTITATKVYTLENPVTTTVTIDAISLDTGTSSTDFVTKDNDGLTITGTLNTALTAGQKLWYSGDNGVTWIDITTDVSGMAVSHVDPALTSTNTVQMRVESAGGNYGTAATQLVTIDASAPAFTSTSTATAVDENIAALTTVYTATATDARTVSYSLKAGTDASSFSIDTTTGVVKLIGSPDYETKASYSFTVLATDSVGNTSEQVVSLAINNVNEAPINTVPGTQTATEDVNKVIAGLSISDVDAGTNNVTVTLAVTHGTLTIDAASSGVTVGTNNTASVTLTGSQAQINALLLGATGVTYVPTTNFNGTDTLTMTTNDGGNTGLGNALSDEDTVTINVTAVNDQPAAVALSYTGLEDNGGVNLATAPVPTGTMGALVSSLSDILSSSNDVDNTNLGLAITSGLSTSANGKLWYSTNNGSTWTDLSTLSLSETNALVLSSSARLYFQGNANVFGSMAIANMRLWDGTDSATSGSLVDVTAASGASGAYAAANSTLTLNLTAINDEPTLSAKDLGIRTNVASNLGVFNDVQSSLGNAAESAQKFISLTLTVSGLFDDSAESLTIDGTTVALVNGSTTTTNGWTASVNLANGSTSDTATVTLTRASGATVSELNTLVDGISYSNATSSPTDGDRVFTLTSLQDNGGTTNGGDDTVALNIASTITLDTTASATLATIDAIHDDIGLIQGVIANNGKTDDTSLNLSGTLNNVLAPGEQLRIYDGTTLLGTAIVTTTGATSTWTFVDYRSLIDAQTVVYKAVVFDGLNEGIFSNTYSATVDLTPPAITITSVVGDTLTLAGTDSTGNGTYDAVERGTAADTATTLPVISGTTTAEAGQLVYLTLNSKTYSTAVQVGGTWSVELPNADAVALNHGNTLPIIAAVTDQAGLSATDTNNQLVVNIAAPDVPTVNNKFSSTLTPTLTGVAQKAVPTDPVTYIPLATGDTLTVTVGGATYTGTLDTSAVNNGLPTGLSYDTATNQWSLNTATAMPTSGSLTLASGNSYDVDVTVNAGSATEDDISTNELRINTTPPVITLDVISGDSLIDASEKNTPLLITGTTDAEVGSIVTITGLDGTPRNATVIAGTGPNSGTNVFSVTVPATAVSALTDNTYTVEANVTNVYGLNGSDTEPVKVDYVASTTTVTITAINDDVGTVTGVVSHDGRTDDTQLGVSGTLNTNLVAGEVVQVYDGSTLLGTATVTGTTWTFADPRTLINAQKVTYTALVFDGANKGTVSNSYSATVDLTPPTVVNDTNIAKENGGAGNAVAGTDPSGDVLSNDTAGANDSLSVKDVTGASSATAVATTGTTNIVGSYGTLTIAANGSYSYAVDQTNATVQALNASSTGLSEIFTYTAKDVAGLTTTATLTITVNGANDAATFSGNLSQAITESNAAQSASGTLTVTDVDSPTTVIAQSNVAGSAGLGKFSIDSAGVWSYLMDNAQNQLKPSDVITDSLTVTTADGTNQVISVVITGTNDAPVLTTSSVLTYTEGQAATAINTLISVADVDNTTQTSAQVAITSGYASTEDVLSFVGDSATMGNITGNYNAGVMSLVSAGGTATLAQWQAALQAVKYSNTSSNPSTASRTVSYTLNDGTLNSEVLTSTINLVGVNNPPVNTVPGAQSTAEDTAKVMSGLSIADTDAGTGTVTVTLSVAHGTISVAAGTGVTLTTNGTASVTLSGTVADINTLLATASAVSYTPTLDYNGSDTLTMVTNDGGNTGGAALTDTDYVDITVTPVNDAPVIVTPANALSTLEDTATTFVISSQLTGKVTDAEGTALKGIVIVQSLFTAANPTVPTGTWAYSTDGTTWVDFPTNYLGVVDWTKVMYLNATDSLRFTPFANTNGASLADLNFRAVDATFPNTASGTQVNVTSTIGGTGAVSNQAGHFTVSVTDVNDAPTLTVTGISPTVTSNAAASVFSTANANTGNSFESAQTFKTLVITVDGLQDGVNEKLTIDGTVITLTDATSTPASTNGWTASVSVVNGKATVTLSNSAGTTATALDTLINGIQYTDSQATFTDGTRVVTITSLQDNGGTSNGGADTASLNLVSTIVVVGNAAPVNTAPTSTLTTNEDTAKAITGLSVADDGQGSTSYTVTLTATNGVLNVSGGTATIAGTGTSTVTLTGTLAAINATLAATVSYVPTANYNGAAKITMVSNDNASSGAKTDTDDINITVNLVNDAPVLTPGAATSYTEQGAATAVNSTLTVSDVDSPNLTGATITLDPATFKATDVLAFTNANGITGSYNSATGVMTLSGTATVAQYQAALQSVTFNNTSDAPGTSRTVKWTVTDDATLSSAIGSSTINITPVNDAPVMTDADGLATNPLGATGATAVVSSPIATGVDGTIANGTPYVNTFGLTTATVTGQIGTNYAGIISLANEQPENVNIAFSLPVSKITATWLGVDTGDNLKIKINGQQLTLTSAMFSGSVSLSADKLTAVGSGTSATYNMTINASDVPGGVINSITLEGVGGGGGLYTSSFIATESLYTAAQTVTQLFAGVYSDVDPDAMKGVVITSAGQGTDSSTLGVYVYSSDNGATWNTLASGLSDSSSVFLKNTDQIRFIRSTANGSSTNKPDLIARLVDTSGVDSTSSLTSGTVVDVSGTNNGGSTAFSDNTITLKDLNLQPTSPASVTVTGLEDAAAPVGAVGTSIASLVELNGMDPEGVAVGLAFVAQISSTANTFYYSLNNGTTWVAAPTTAYTTSNALILPSTALVYFKGAANFNGTLATTSVRLWDGTDGATAGATKNISTLTGANGAYSATNTTLNLVVTAVNDTPVNTVPAAQTATEDTAKVITGLQIADVDAGTATNMSVTLSVVNGTITMLPGAGTVTLTNNGTSSVTLTGTLANINTLLALANAVTYKGNLNYNGADTLTMLTSDNGNTGTGGTLTDSDNVTITVSAANDAPVNTVPGAQTTAEDTPLVITGLQMTDVDNTTGMSVTLAVTNGIINVLPGTGVTIATNSTASVKLTGTQADINALLATANAVTYTPTLNYSGSATLTMTTSDGALSDADPVTITVTPVNDPPVLTVPSTITYVENATGAVINAGIGLQDVDNSASLASATVSITGGFEAGKDVLSFTNSAMGNITATYNSATGVMTLTSAGATATVTNWTNALRAVKFNSTTDNPLSARTIRFVLNDGTSDSNFLDSTVNFTASNDAPINTVPTAQTGGVGIATPITGLSIADADANSGNMQVTLSMPAASGVINVSGGTATITGSGTSSVVLTGTLAAINSTLAASVTYTLAANAPVTNTLTMLTTDNGNTGGAALTDSDPITITAQNIVITNTQVVSTSAPAPVTETFTTSTTLQSQPSLSTAVFDITTQGQNLTLGKSDLWWFNNGGSTGTGQIMLDNNATIGDAAGWFLFKLKPGNTMSGTLSMWLSGLQSDKTITFLDINGNQVGTAQTLLAPGPVITTKTFAIPSGGNAVTAFKISGLADTFTVDDISFTGQTTSTTTINNALTTTTGTSTSVTPVTVNGTLNVALAANEVVEVFRNGVSIGNATVTGTTWKMVDSSLNTVQTDLYEARIKNTSTNTTVAESNDYLINPLTLAITSAGADVGLSDSFTSATTSGILASTSTALWNVSYPVHGLYQTADSVVDSGAWGLSGGTLEMGPTRSAGQSTATFTAKGGATFSGLTYLTGYGSASQNPSSPVTVKFYDASNTLLSSKTYTLSTDAVANKYNFSHSFTGQATYFTITTDGNNSYAIDNVAYTTTTGASSFTIASGESITDTTPVLKGTIPRALVAGETVDIFLDGATTPIGTATINAGETAWTWTQPTALSTATHTYVAKIKSGGAYIGTSNTFSVVVAATPLVLDLNEDGVQTLGIEQGVQFDLLSTGTKQSVGWVDKHDGLLAIDLNADGQITSGTELFGDQTVLADGSLAKDGWLALAAQDSNADGIIDAKDANFDKLRVWVDADSDGLTDAGELLTLAQAKVASINLHHDTNSVQQNGNVVQAFSSYTATDGETQAIADVGFQVKLAGQAQAASDGFVGTDEPSTEAMASLAEGSPAAESSVYSLTNGQSLDLTAFLQGMSANGPVNGLAQVDMTTDTAANVVSLTLADVLSLPITNGMHQLILSGDANDKVMLVDAEWTDTGSVINQAGHNYAVYTGTTDPSAQLLIDQHMLQSHQTS